MSDAVLDNITVPAPLHISSRLMAALHVENAGTLHLHFIGYDTDEHENRPTYHYVVEDTNGVVIHEGRDLWGGHLASVDYLAMMESLLSFLLHYAEEYDYEEGGTFNEWCYLHSEELEIAQFDLQEVIA